MSRIVIAEDRCKGCGLCTLACPYGLVQVSDRFNLKGHHPAEWVDPLAVCTGCADCATMCPDLAIIVLRTLRHNGTGQSQHTRPWRTAVQKTAAQGLTAQQVG
jgi:2-oxoglutarate ferredoxin oxidoreductase subunit delta